MLFSKTGIGLDIGSQKIKLVKVKRQGNKIEPVLFKCMDTPPGTVDSGTIIDPELLGEAIADLVNDLKISGSRAVSAIGGQQIYIKNFVMPHMKQLDLRRAAFYQSSSFLPISPDEAVMDVCPVRRFTDGEGRKTDVFFVAARKMQLDNLLAVYQAAGLKPSAVEIEPLALYRLFKSEDDIRTLGILNFGAYRSYLAVFDEGVLTSLRHLSLGCSAFLQGVGWGEVEQRELDGIDLNEDSNYSYLLGDIITELSRTLEYFSMQTGGHKVNKVLLTGGGSRIKGLTDYLSSALGYSVEQADIEKQVKVPPHLTEHERRQIMHDYPVALGLAARGVI